MQDKNIQELISLYHSGEFNTVEKKISKLIKEKPDNFILYNILGAVFDHKKNLNEAANNYRKSIKINPSYAEGYNNLGTVLYKLDKIDESINNYKYAIKIKPDFAEAYNNLGDAFFVLKNNNEAIECYKKVISLNPKSEKAYNNLGIIFKRLEKYEKAVECYKKAIDINQKFFEAYNNLGVVYKKQRKYEEANKFYKKAITINPKYVMCRTNLGNSFHASGNYIEAIKCYDEANKIDPNYLTAYWQSLNTFPTVYKETKEINFFRNRFLKNLNKINQLLDKNLRFKKEEIIETLESSTNFSLHYQGRNDLELQCLYAKIIEKLTKKIYPHFFKKKEKKMLQKKLKVGFVSAYFRRHSVSKMYKNWIIKIDKNKFSTYVYSVSNLIDETTNLIQKNSNFFYNSIDVDSLINKISSDNIDALIYLDIGMEPKIQILASLRLASVQCLGIGHPVTSGMTNIDFALSSELMETENAQKYYKEKLIKLPNTSQCYPEPEIKLKNKERSSRQIIFLNLQSLFKLLPEDDDIYLNIAKKIPDCQFWFIENINKVVTETFRERIFKLFENSKMPPDNFFVFHKQMNQEEFFNLINQSDVILDSLNWSGNISSHEAISLKKPIVTLPGPYMRGRTTYSILKILDIEETIAKTKKEYVDIAFRLAKDINFRNLICQKIEKNKNKLFNDKKPIKYLENFLMSQFKNFMV